MFANVDPNTVKQQSEMLKNMSDEELKRQIDAAKLMMPGTKIIILMILRYAGYDSGNDEICFIVPWLDVP